MAFREQRSRFIARALRYNSAAAVVRILRQVRGLLPDATHICYASRSARWLGKSGLSSAMMHLLPWS